MSETHQTGEEIVAGSADAFDKMATHLEKFVLPQSAKLANGDMHHGGITKRELFAAMSMQGFASLQENGDVFFHPEGAAKVSVQWADALLKELAK